MPRKTLPRIVAVLADKKPLVLCVQWDNGTQTHIDVSSIINILRVYEPLRHSQALFHKVQLGENGTDIIWPNDMYMSAQTLWRLSQEQAGLTMSPDAFKVWRESKAFTLDSAASALGLSRRMVAYYEQGTKPIPVL